MCISRACGVHSFHPLKRVSFKLHDAFCEVWVLGHHVGVEIVDFSVSGIVVFFEADGEYGFRGTWSAKRISNASAQGFVGEILVESRCVLCDYGTYIEEWFDERKSFRRCAKIMKEQQNNGLSSINNNVDVYKGRSSQKLTFGLISGLVRYKV